MVTMAPMEFLMVQEVLNIIKNYIYKYFYLIIGERGGGK